MTTKSPTRTNYPVPSVENKRTNYSVPIFDRSKFLGLNQLYGPITLDAFATAYSTVSPRFCNNVEDFLRVPLRGETMWVQCAYHEILSVLEYLEAESSTNPYDVRALLIVPQYGSTGYDSAPTKMVKYY